MISINYTVRAALAVGALVATGAAQAIDLPSTGNGSLVLFVTNTATNQVYVRDLGIHVNNIITEGTGAGQTADPAYGNTPGVISLSYLLGGPIGPDLTLTNFLGTGTTGDFTWNVLAADTAGNSTFATPRRYVLTTNTDLSVTSPPNNGALGTLSNSAQNGFTQVNNTLAGGNSVVAGAGNGPGQIDISLINTFWNQSPSHTSGGLGSSLNFYLLSSSSAANGTTAGGNALAARVFVLNDLTLSATGVLTSSEVPLPAAVWLLGSGLLGMAGIGRRRKQANGQLAA